MKTLQPQAKVFPVYSGCGKLFFGVNAVKELKTYISRRKMLIVTGRRSAKISGALDEAVEILKNVGAEYSVFSGVRPNPSIDDVLKIVKAYRDAGSDSLLAIGGGSVIDVAKATKLLITCGGDIKDYLYGRKKCGARDPPLYAINLTHGTGTEVDRWAVVTIPETKEKLGMEACYPDVAIDDPKYTVTLPRTQTIYVTLDAFAHAIESATSSTASPYVTLLSEEAIRYIVKYLPAVVDDPKNLEARYWLLYASMLAGISIDHAGTHVGHAIEHVLSGINPNLPHGAGLGILYNALIKYFYKSCPEAMAKLLAPLNPALKPRSEDAEKAQQAYNAFLEKINFQESLGTYGFGLDDANTIADIAYDNPILGNWIKGSPIKIDKKDIAEIIKKLV